MHLDSRSCTKLLYGVDKRPTGSRGQSRVLPKIKVRSKRLIPFPLHGMDDSHSQCLSKDVDSSYFQELEF